MIVKTADEIINLNDNNTFSAEQISTKQKIHGNYYKSVLDKNVFAIVFNVEGKEIIAYYNFRQKNILVVFFLFLETMEIY